MEIEDLTKHYGDVRALDGVSLQTAPGEIFGLLGHNGAGKSTMIRILTGRATPTSGRARVLGHDVPRDLRAVRGQINLVADTPNVYERATAKENLELFCGLYGLPRSRALQALEHVRLGSVAARKVKTFSTGMRQRLLLARALLNSPRVLFLDEPTRGLDPRSARELHETVTALAAGGTTIFLTTHNMNDADELCQRVAFLAEGRLVALDTPRALKLSLANRAPRDRGRARRRHTGAAEAREAARRRTPAGTDRRGPDPLNALARADARRRLHPPRGTQPRGRSRRRDRRMVSARRIVAILIKDLRDAGRDGRILLLLLTPIGGAVLYNATSPDAHELPTVQVAIVDAGGRGVADELRAAAGQSVKVDVQRTRDRVSAQRLVAAKDVDFAVVVAPSERLGPARAEVLVSEGASATAQSVIALVPDALTRAAGRAPGAQTQVRVVAATHRKPADRLESRELTVLVMIVLLLVFVAMIVVPIQIAEEIETGTLGALRLAAPGAEILAAKALAGFLYGLAGVGLTVLLTQIHVHNPLQLFAAAFALSASLVGFGLMMGLLWPNSAAINTYAGFLALPLIGLAGAALFIDPGVFATILNLLPFPQATKLLADGLSPTPHSTPARAHGQ